VNRHCRLTFRSECTTSDLMLFQYQLNYADSTKMEHYSISARQFCIICHFKVCPAAVLHSSKTHQHSSRQTRKSPFFRPCISNRSAFRNLVVVALNHIKCHPECTKTNHFKIKIRKNFLGRGHICYQAMRIRCPST